MLLTASRALRIPKSLIARFDSSVGDSCFVAVVILVH